MRSVLILIIVSLLFSFKNNFSILDEVLNSDDWVIVNQKSDSLSVYKKNIDGIKIPVFKATMITSVHLEGVMDAVLDANGQQEFLADSHLKESRLLDYSILDTTFLYQILDLPIISNRHYITKNYTDTIKAGEHYQMNWLIDSEQNQELFSDFIATKSAQYKNPIFITDGLGSWELKRLNPNQTEVTYYVLIDPGGMIPDYLVSYANRTVGPGTVIAMVEEGRKRSKNREVVTSILFCINKSEDYLSYKKLSLGPILIVNNSDLQAIMLKHSISSLEPWMPSASENDCNGDVCLDKIYRIEIQHNGKLDIEQIISDLTELPSVLYAEPDAARNIFNK